MFGSNANYLVKFGLYKKKVNKFMVSLPGID